MAPSFALYVRNWPFEYFVWKFQTETCFIKSFPAFRTLGNHWKWRDLFFSLNPVDRVESATATKSKTNIQSGHPAFLESADIYVGTGAGLPDGIILNPKSQFR
jgi:hypothetical protein